MRKTALTLGALALGAAVVVHAEQPAQIVDARQQHMKEIGKAMKASVNSFKSGSPDAAMLKANAAIMAGYADKLGGWFPVGTAAGGVIKTNAKPEIWTDKAGFAKASTDFSVAVKAYKAVADTGDLAAASKSLSNLGGTCKGCHDKFKLKDQN